MFDSVMALSHHRSRRCLRTVLKIRRIAVQDCLALRLVVRRTLGKVTTITECTGISDGEYYLAWAGRSNNSHPKIRFLKVLEG